MVRNLAGHMRVPVRATCHHVDSVRVPVNNEAGQGMTASYIQEEFTIWQRRQAC